MWEDLVVEFGDGCVQFSSSKEYPGLVSIREARAKVFLILMHIGRMDRTQSQPALTGVDVSSKVCGGYTIAGLRILPEVADHIYEKVI